MSLKAVKHTETPERQAISILYTTFAFLRGFGSFLKAVVVVVVAVVVLSLGIPFYFCGQVKTRYKLEF